MAAVHQHTTIIATSAEEWARVLTLAADVESPYVVTLNEPTWTAQIEFDEEVAY